MTYAKMVDARTRESVLKLDFGLDAAPVRSLQEKKHTRCTPGDDRDRGPEGVCETADGLQLSAS